jgi:hypothetical protein
VRREVMYNILIEFGVPRKLVRLIKMCLNETNSKVHIGKHVSYSFPIQDNIDTIKKNTEALIDAGTEVVPEINVENMKYMLLFHHQNAGQNCDIE